MLADQNPIAIGICAWRPMPGRPLLEETQDFTDLIFLEQHGMRGVFIPTAAHKASAFLSFRIGPESYSFSCALGEWIGN